MDRLTTFFLQEAGLCIAGAILCGVLGYSACRFIHRHDVRDAVDLAHRRIEDRTRKERLGIK